MRERGFAPAVPCFAASRPEVTLGAMNSSASSMSVEADSPTAADDWTDLMVRAQAGDGQAYARLLGALLPTLRAQVRRRVPDRDRAEDVVQDVLLSVHRNRHTFDPALPFIPWLRTIAERRILDSLRRQYRQSGREIQVETYPETPAEDGANESLGESLPLAGGDGLRRVIEQLPPKQRTAIELLKLKEMSLKEASAATGMSVAALKVTSHRAIRNLRALLAP